MDSFEAIIQRRRSIRKFKDMPVEKSKVDKLLQAALLAPSGKRMFPCEFVAIDNKEILQALSECKSHGAKLISGAPLAIAIVANTKLYDVWVEDASVASTFVMLAAESLNLGCCWVQMHLRGTQDGNSSTDNMKHILNIPDGFELLSVLAIGYKDEEKPIYKNDELQHHKVHYNKLNLKK